MTDEFEAEFGGFLDSDTYDTAEETLFSLLRLAFSAGWEAAGGGRAPKRQPPAQASDPPAP